jgi:FkbM family methyltransferase
VAEPRLIEVASGERIYGTSPIDVRFLYREIFEWGSYRGLALPERPLVVDAGANVGLFTLFLKRQCPDARVLAFEPVPQLAEAARRNVAHFGLTDVTVHTIALGAAPASAVRLRHYPLRPSGSSLVLDDQTALQRISTGWLSPRVNDRLYRSREVTVDVVPLSRYLPDRRRVDLLKIDVVGVELDVLHGVTDAQWQRVDQVVVDVQEQDGRVGAVSRVLSGHGMTVTVGQSSAAAGDGVNFLVRGRRDRQ